MNDGDIIRSLTYPVGDRPYVTPEQSWEILQTHPIFKDCKTGGDHLKSSRVNIQRFLALAMLVSMADGLVTISGQMLEKDSLKHYLVRSTSDKQRFHLRHSSFTLGLARDGYPHIHALLMDLAHQFNVNQAPQVALFSERSYCHITPPDYFPASCHP